MSEESGKSDAAVLDGFLAPPHGDGVLLQEHQHLIQSERIAGKKWVAFLAMTGFGSVAALTGLGNPGQRQHHR